MLDQSVLAFLEYQKGCFAMLGVSLHVYADTWAHEGFTAGFNLENSSGPNFRIRPPVGHAMAPEYGHSPDMIILNKENRNKALEAAEYIYNILPSPNYDDKIMSWESVRSYLEQAFEVYSDKKHLDDDLSSKIVISRLEKLFGPEFGIVKYNLEKYKKLEKYFKRTVNKYFQNK